MFHLVLSLFRTFIDLYIRCFVLSLFRSISISLLHTPVVSHFMVSSILHRSFVPQYLYSMVLCSPVSMHLSTYVPRSRSQILPLNFVPDQLVLHPDQVIL